MPERNGPAVDVHLVVKNVQFLHPGEHHRRERLVDLDQVDVVHRHAGLLQGMAGGRDRSGQHPHRIVGQHRQVMDAGPRRQLVLGERTVGGDQQRGGSVGDLAGDRSGDRAALLERLEAADLLPVGLTGALIPGNVAQWGDLGVEAARVPGPDRPLVALDGERFHLVAAALPFVGDHLRRAELADFLVPVALLPAGRAGEGVGVTELLADEHRRADGDRRHLLHAAGDDQVGRARHHRLGGEVHRLLGGAALAVDCRTGHVIGQTRGQPGGSGDVAGLPADRVDAPEDHVLDRARVHPGAFHQRLEAVRPQVGGVDRREAPAPSPHRGANCVDDVGLGHRVLQGLAGAVPGYWFQSDAASDRGPMAGPLDAPTRSRPTRRCGAASRCRA